MNISIVKKKPLYFFYLIILVLLSIGLYEDSGLRFFPFFVSYIALFSFFYFGFNKLMLHPFTFGFNKIIDKLSLLLNKSIRNYISYFFFFFSIFFIIIHLFNIGYVPFISAYNSLDYYGIALIRQSITEDNSKIINYASSILLKAIIPFFLIYYFKKKDFKLFYLFLFISFFYSLCMMQKSYIVNALIPLILICLLEKRYVFSILFIAIAVLGVFLLVFITNPHLRVSEKQISKLTADSKNLAREKEQANDNGKSHKYYMSKKVFDTDKREQHDDKVQEVVDYIQRNHKPSISLRIFQAIKSVYNRIILVPGKVVSMWFNYIPSRFSFSNGCGYRFIAPFKDCKYEDFNYARLIYDTQFPGDAEQGMKGTINATSFMYDYSNFGFYGLILAAFILAVFFTGIEIIFNYDFKWILTFNFSFILWLSSSALYSMLLSGGWGLTILLFFLFKNDIQEGK
jgi:hypothetical protein